MGKKVTTISGLSGFGFLLAGVGAPKVIEGLPSWVNIALFAGGGALVLAAFVAHLLGSRKDEGTAITASTTEAGSHALAGTFNAPIHINPAPAVQERKYPGRIQRPHRDIAADEARRLRQREAEAKRCPEMPIAEAIEYVAGVIFDMAVEDCYPGARREIRQAALEARIDVWGKHEIPPQTHDAKLRARQVWRRIEPSYWENYELVAYATDNSTDDQPHTQMEEFISGGSFNRYWSLRVRKLQLRLRWHGGVSQ